MRALIVDDHGIARRGVASLLESTFDDLEWRGVDNGGDAIAAATQRSPDLILMDLGLPGNPQGHVLCAQLRNIAPAAIVVVVTASGRTEPIKQCLAAGADGALLKDTADVDLADALRRASLGETVVSPTLAERLAQDMVGVLRGDDVIQLSPREREVLDLLGKTALRRPSVTTSTTSSSLRSGRRRAIPPRTTRAVQPVCVAKRPTRLSSRASSAIVCWLSAVASISRIAASSAKSVLAPELAQPWPLVHPVDG